MSLRWAARNDHEMFTQGGCHKLAQAIKEITGWTVCAFEGFDGGPDGHAFVRTPRGTYLDIEGEHADETDFCIRWHAGDVVEVDDPYELDEWDDCFDMSDAEYRAKELAPDLVAAYYEKRLPLCLR